MATTVQHLPAANKEARPRPTSFGDGQHHKAVKTKRNELRLERDETLLREKRDHDPEAQFPQQNGGVAGNEEYSVATFLARIGMALEGQGAGMVKHINNKESDVDEPKEEDDDEPKDVDPCETKEEEEDGEDGVGTPESGLEEKMTSSGTQTMDSKPGLSSLYHGTWPVERTLWHSGPSSLGSRSLNQQDVASVMSFASSVGPTGADMATRRTYSQQQLGAKVEMVYNLLSMLGTHDRDSMSKTLLAMSSSPDSCIAMRQSGCLPLLVQLLHAPDQTPETRQRASQALHNIVYSHPDDKRGRREARVLRLLEQVRDYCDSLRAGMAVAANNSPEAPRPLIHEDMTRHPGPAIAALMKLSFDEEHRHAMCQLGGLHAVAELIQVDHEAHGSTTADQYCVTLRRYAGMALTNLTFGDGTNKALLCSFRQFMRALVAQLNSPSEDLRQVTASVLRNLSWRADSASKQTLREVGAVSGLMRAAMEGKKESTLKSILSALWNLSAHCSINKVDICAVDGALGFLVEMLSYKAPSKTLAIIENAGGILRNISSHIAVREDYRAILREHNCLQVLLQQLKSPSLTVVSNACGTLWNLSARCAEDQRALWEMGAVSMLRSLVHSKHKMISMGSSAALKNLLSARPDNTFPPLDSTLKGMGLPALPSLYVRKQRALEQELDQTLSETCDNIEPSTSPSASATGSFSERHCHSAERRHSRLLHGKYRRGPVARSDSRDSVTSTLSDSVYERVSRTVVNVYGYGQVSPTNEVSQTLSNSEDGVALHSSLNNSSRVHSQISTNEYMSSERRFLRRYCNSMREREERRKVVSLDLSCEDNEKHPLPQPSLAEHNRLGQIDEGVYRSASDQEQEKSQNRTVDNQQQDRTSQDTEDGDDIRLGSNVQLDVMSLRPASPVKPPKTLLYDSVRSSNQRSAFSPLVGSPYSTGSRGSYQQSRASSAYTSVRNKYSDLGYEDAESQDQPIDYSLKYVEDPVNTLNTSEEASKGVPEAETVKSETFERSGRVECATRSKQNQNDLGRGYGYKNQVSNTASTTNKNMKMNVVYGDYAETDLDQPTDYSLKYPEEEEEEDDNGAMESQERGYYESGGAVHEDTLKTYCTEGTPYETPYNFSTATSMSDLHCEPPTPHSEEAKEAEQCLVKEEHVESSVKVEEENKVVKEEDESNFDNGCLEKEPQMKSLPPAPRPPVKGLQSGLSSGLMSPEKPVQYCEEGTPGYFSRVSSLSSLHSLPVVHADGGSSGENQVIPEVEQVTGQAGTSPTEHDPPEKTGSNKDEDVPEAGDTKEEPRADREGKVVTFGRADHYAEETPLMFSRCSSLGSLSSFEQHSIHDDRSSVVSDFSRRTSGIVSPSELPDSPTQTVPPSPHHSKPPVEFTSQLPEDAGAVRTTPLPAARHRADRANLPKTSVFEDDVAAFKEEDTPVEFSRATSLSSLTIDDEPKISNDAMLKEVVPKPVRPVVHRVPGRTEREHEEGMEKQDVEKEKRELADCCDLAPVSEGEEENEDDMLAACISIGMQNTRQRQSQQNSSPARLYGPQTRSGRPSGIPVKAIPRPRQQQQQQDTTGTPSKSMNFMEVPGGACEDAVRTYCTEGTPANISHAGSHSDLSVLSLPCDGDLNEVQREAGDAGKQVEGEEETGEKDGERPELSDDSSNFSGDNDNILAECIQSGMPKARSQPLRRIPPQTGSVPSEETQTKKTGPPPRRPAPPRAHHLCGLDHGPRPTPVRKPHGKTPCQPRMQRVDEPKPVSLPQCLAARDELETYATEGSPNTFSTRSSLSDLTINSAEPGTVASCLRRSAQSHPPSEGTPSDTPLRFATEDTPLEVSHAASLSSLSIGEDEEEEEEFNTVMEDARPASGASSVHSPLPPHGAVLNSSERPSVSPLHKVLDAESLSSPVHLMMASDGSWGDRSERHEDSLRLHNKNSSASEDMVTVLSRNGSLSSLSVDSFGSTEPTPSEQALLEQCISSGMPKSKSDISSCKGSRIALPVGSKKKVGGGCKIPVPAHLGGDRQVHGTSFMPMQKLELKPHGRREIAIGGIESGMARMTLDDEAGGSSEHLPKNGLDSSAAVVTTAAADVDEDIAVTGKETESTEKERTTMKTENDCHAVPVTPDICTIEPPTIEMCDNPENELLVVETITSDDGTKVLEIDIRESQTIRTTLYESATRNVTRDLYHIDHETYTPKRLLPKQDVISPQGSSSDDKSPLSSGESPSSELASDDRNLTRKMQEADAMIASLDRMTEELVLQTEDLNHKEKNGEPGVMKQSLVGSDTWNEDTSPNDVSFPSLSMSAPLIASFKSDNREDNGALPDLAEEDSAASNQQETSMTDSRIIELEAGKVAVAVRAEAAGMEDMEHSITSLNSMDLDAIKPPSMMGSLVSLTTSLSGQLDNAEGAENQERCNSLQQRLAATGSRVECRHSRKKSLPVGMMVRRALGNNHNGSIENLLDNTSASSSCNSHLDNIKPPSAMEEVIDVVDMENSMISVASITSEVADSSGKDQSNSDQSPANSDAIFDLLRPAASVMAEVYAAHYASTAMSASVKTSSASDCLDNINPPSAFNEIGDMTDQESAMEPGTETICSDTEMCTEDPAQTYTVDSPDGSRKATPVPSDQYATSSAESTPKKNKLKARQLTPKQRRQLVKERYRTYTIAGEEERKLSEMKPQISGGLQESVPGEEQTIEGPLQEVTDITVKSEQGNETFIKSPNSTKVTPKQRRIEDRSRFQTQVLDKPVAIQNKQSDTPESEIMMDDDGANLILKQDDASVDKKAVDVQKSELPIAQKSSSMKTIKQKRAEAKERFQTRTLSEDKGLSRSPEKGNEPCEIGHSDKSGLDYVEALLNITPEEFETLLEHDANVVISTLNENRGTSESSEVQSSDDMLLDCETLSLVSIESESEHYIGSTPHRPSLDLKKCFTNMETAEGEMPEEPEVFEDDVMEKTEPQIEQVKLETEQEEIEPEDQGSEESESSDEDLPQGTKGPRITKPGSEKAQSLESVNTEDGTVNVNSPKPVRGRRKALYSSPGARRPTVKPSSLPKSSRPQSSIPIVGKSAIPSPGSVRPTRASALRQTVRGSSTTPSPHSLSRTPSSGGASPLNISPKTSKGIKGPQRYSGLKTPSPSSKASTPRSAGSGGSLRTPNNTPNTSYTPNNSDRNLEEIITVEDQQGKDPRFRPPERQGTFTKEEPTITTAPKTSVPSSPTKTRIPVPSSLSSPVEKIEGTQQVPDTKKKRIPKAIPVASKPKQSMQSASVSRSVTNTKLTKGSSSTVTRTDQKFLQKASTIPAKSSGTRLPAAKLANRRSIAGGEMKTSLSNQSLNGGKSTMTANQRSNSNCSLTSVTSGGTLNVKKAGIKKEVTSKIAGLWKKVEENKQKQKFQKKDARVWITSSSNRAELQDENIPSPPRLVRSSTFEGLPSKEIKNQGMKDVNDDPQLQRIDISESTSRLTAAEIVGVGVVQPITRTQEGNEVWIRREDRGDVASIEKSATEVVLRRKRNNAKSSGVEENGSDNPKRLSRLGSFIRIDPSEGNAPASAIVPPYNYNPPLRSETTVSSHIPTPIKRSESYITSVSDDRPSNDASETEFSTASLKVTTV